MDWDCKPVTFEDFAVLRTELATVKARLAEAERLLGDAAHQMSMIDDPEEGLGNLKENICTFLTPTQLSDPDTCCGEGLCISKNHTHWNCSKCGKILPMAVTPVEQPSDKGEG